MARWNGRGLTSLLTFGGFIIMAISGLVLYAVPQGRVAYWIDWRLLGLSKHQWGDIHILASILFLVAGIVHTYLNWGRLWSYLRDKAHGGVKLKRELALTVAAVVLVSVSGAAKLPPLSYLLSLNEAIKHAWVSEKDYEPPFGHAELLSLAVFCQKTDIPLAPALAELKRRKLKGVDPARSLEKIAKANGMSALDLYRLIKRFEKPRLPAKALVFTPQRVEATFAGTGIGNKSLVDLAKRAGQPPQKLGQRLKALGLKVDSSSNLKVLAKRNKMPPLELLKAALVDGYRPSSSSR